MATTSTISSLAPDVQNRVQDPGGVFWNLQFEINAALAEAVNELLLILGRPTQFFDQVVTLQANTCFQPMPPGVLAITNIRGTLSQMWKTTLRTLDYMQGSWNSSWASDRAAQPARWAPLGLSQFIVHPAPLQPISVNITGVAYPFTGTWPPTGAETVPFQKNLDQALEMYAASYLRIKDIGQDFQEGQLLYQRFMDIARRATTLEDRRDDLVFSYAAGAPTAITQNTKR